MNAMQKFVLVLTANTENEEFNNQPTLNYFGHLNTFTFLAENKFEAERELQRATKDATKFVKDNDGELEDFETTIKFYQGEFRPWVFIENDWISSIEIKTLDEWFEDNKNNYIGY